MVDQPELTGDETSEPSTDRSARTDAEKRRSLERSEQPILTDGQLGSDLLSRPEKRNPEGSSNLSLADYSEG